jgi:6-phosphogluconolactonase
MRIRVLADPDAVAHAAADLFVDIADEASRARGRVTVALAGGSTPRRLYALLADPAQPHRHRGPWAVCHFFWGDERHVPPDHPESNAGMALDAMISRLPIPETQVHRIPAERPDAAAAAREYERVLREFFGDVPFPVFDLVLLGMGADGHTASLLPGTDAVREKTRWVAATWVEKFKSFRITLTAPAINRARHVIFMVAGSDKAAAVRDVLEGPPDAERLPAQLIRPTSGSLTWLLDRAAAAALSKSTAAEAEHA